MNPTTPTSTTAPKPVLTQQQLAANTTANNLANYGPIPNATIQKTPIPAGIIGNTTQAQIPPVPQNPNYPAIIAGATAGVPTTTPSQVTPETPQQPQQKSFKDTLTEVLGLKQAPEKTADAYAKAEQDAGIKQKQQLVNSLSNQLNALNAESQTVTTQVQQNNQNTGATDQGINPQVAGQLRVIALKSLPISAQLSAAQGDLSTAQTHLDNYFKLVVADANAQTEYYNKAVDTAYSMFDKAEQNQLADIRAQKASDTQSMRDAVNNTQALAKQALDNGDTATFKTLTSIPAPNPSSPTYAQDLATYNQTVATAGATMKQDPSKALDTQYKKAQIANIYSEIEKRNSDAVKEKNLANFVTPPLVNPVTTKLDPTAQLSSVIKSTGIKDNTNLQNILGVVTATQQFAEASPDGKFTGISFGSYPGGHSVFAGPKGIANSSNIEAINLKVQQWASGAALTDAQTKQVAKITPKYGDTNSQLRSKTNALADFMQGQARSLLASQGINYQPEKIDYFKPIVMAPDGQAIQITN